ncbi:SOS response-associated peptidase family protein [Sphingomonas sp. 1P06PA]|uniref:SOS response-associated peptidase family protein n=1 Tax=Sphingomonas sp. 1P06PA TaxID=554121 RepID=UPI0039A5846A
MCNRARNKAEPETLFSHFGKEFGGNWLTDRPMDNRFNPVELVPRGRAYVIREEDGRRGLDVMSWDLLGKGAAYPITNVRDLKRWRPRLEKPEGRCLIPLTEFCEWTPEAHDVGGGKPIKGEMWFGVTDQPLFAVAGVWQQLGDQRWFAMLTCDPNELVAPIHPKAMITILHADDHDRWLTGSYAEVLDLQRPYPASLMTVTGPVFPTRRSAVIAQ